MIAGVAQQVERAFRKRQVAGSKPAAGFIRVATARKARGGGAGMVTRDFNGFGAVEGEGLAVLGMTASPERGDDE